MEPSGTAYWISDTFLDWNHDDYYAHSGSWWDVQDSPWLRHLDQPTYTVNVQLGPGVAEVDSDVPGIACQAGSTCTSTWDAGSTFALAASAAPGYLHHAVWTGACPNSSGDTLCSLSVTGDETESVSFLKVLAAGPFSLSYLRRPARVRATLRLSRVPVAAETSLACHGSQSLKLTAHTLAGASAVCTWWVPKRLAGKRVSGSRSSSRPARASLIRSG